MVEDVFAVVQHDQHLTSRTELANTVGQRPTRTLPSTERVRDHMGHRISIVDRGKVTEPDAICETGR
jgi:hypothetical protein